MNLKEIRDQFVNQSGRLDLINDDGSDNGANFYINAGQKYLDHFLEHKRSVGRVFRIISPGEYFVKFQHCRAIHEVGVGTTEGFIWLNRYNLRELRSRYNKPFESLDRSKPYDFAPAMLRPAGTEDDFDGIVGYMDAMTDWETYNGIILLPPADQEYHVEIWGKFYSQKLVNDSDYSFWSTSFDYILIMAAQRAIEVFYRNSQGIKDWEFAIQRELIGVEKDFIEEAFYGYNQMEG